MDARQKVKEGRQRGMEVASRIALDSYLRKDEYLAAHEGPMHDFREALMRHGYCRHFIEESWAFMPQEKDVIVPLVLKCFEQTNVAKERWWLLRWLYYKGMLRSGSGAAAAPGGRRRHPARSLRAGKARDGGVHSGY